MKRGIFLAVLPMLAWLSIAVVQVLIDPYVRQDETYVDRQYRDSAHANADDSWSYAENTTVLYGKARNRRSNPEFRWLWQSRSPRV